MTPPNESQKRALLKRVDVDDTIGPLVDGRKATEEEYELLGFCTVEDVTAIGDDEGWAVERRLAVTLAVVTASTMTQAEFEADQTIKPGDSRLN